MNTPVRNIVLFLLLAGGVYFGSGEFGGTGPAQRHASPPASVSAPTAFDHRHAGRQVQGSGRVTKVLSDDNKGSRHQRFILSLDSGQTILIAHNIDLAPRIPDIEPGDVVSFNGVFETNSSGGVVHWTHHDPAGRHVNGWLKHRGQTFQ